MSDREFGWPHVEFRYAEKLKEAEKAISDLRENWKEAEQQRRTAEAKLSALSSVPGDEKVKMEKIIEDAITFIDAKGLLQEFSEIIGLKIIKSMKGSA